jgi:hypothetical protein
MSIGNQVIAVALKTFVKIWGKGALFTRVVDEVKRANETMPNVTGDDKFKMVFADLKIIFNDLVKPIGTSVLKTLIELGVQYVKLQNPLAGEVVGVVANAVEGKLNEL